MKPVVPMVAGSVVLAAGLAMRAGEPAGDGPLRVAASSSLRARLPGMVEAFEREHPGIEVQVSYGASGLLCVQLERGAPFDVFLSADVERPRRLAERELLTAEGVVHLFDGRVRLVMRAGEGVDELPDRVAIPNPRFAPYGRAAMAWLEANGLAGRELIVADGAAHAAAMLRSGAVSAAFMDQDHAELLEKLGGVVVVALDDAQAIEHAAGVLASSDRPGEARALVEFLHERLERAAEVVGAGVP